MQGPPAVPQQDAGETQSQEQTAKAVKRDAKPAYFPCRLNRKTAGGAEAGASGAGASPPRVVMTLPRPAGRQAARAARCTGGGEAALSSGR
jgi:hypothetical protein